jgi:hypothetical protein
MTEQEAEMELMSEISDEMSGGVPGRETRIPECLAAYRAAVRAETLREVRAEVEKVRGYTLPTKRFEGWESACLALAERLDALAHPEAK